MVLHAGPAKWVGYCRASLAHDEGEGGLCGRDCFHLRLPIAKVGTWPSKHLNVDCDAGCICWRCSAGRGWKGRDHSVCANDEAEWLACKAQLLPRLAEAVCASALHCRSPALHLL